MEKLILERNEEDYYQLEINDKGEYIEFDLTDIGFIERLMEGTEKAYEEDRQYTNEVNEILDNKEIDKAEKATLLLQKEKQYFNTMNKLFDSFLGEGNTNKIFNGKKCYGQYLTLLKALEPHFNKMVLQKQKAKNKLAQRYLRIDSDTL